MHIYISIYIYISSISKYTYVFTCVWQQEEQNAYLCSVVDYVHLATTFMQWPHVIDRPLPGLCSCVECGCI